MAGTPHCPFAYLLARTRSGWRAPSFPADRRVLKPPHHVKVARRRGGRAGGTGWRVGRGGREGRAGVLRAKPGVSKSGCHLSRLSLLGRRLVGDVHLPVGVRLHNKQVQSCGVLYIGVCLIPHGVGRVRSRCVPQESKMYVAVHLTVSVNTYLLVRQPGSAAGCRVFFPERPFTTLSPVVPLSPLGNSSFMLSETIRRKHVSAAPPIFGPLPARRSGSVINALPAKDEN